MIKAEKQKNIIHGGNRNLIRPCCPLSSDVMLSLVYAEGQVAEVILLLIQSSWSVTRAKTPGAPTWTKYFSELEH